MVLEEVSRLPSSGMGCRARYLMKCLLRIFSALGPQAQPVAIQTLQTLAEVRRGWIHRTAAPFVRCHRKKDKDELG